MEGGSNPTGTIWGKQLSTGVTGRVGTGGGFQSFPSISGDLVVWQEQSTPADMTRICGSHLDKADWLVVPLPGTELMNPVVAGHFVVYGLYNDWNDDTATDVYASDISQLRHTQGIDWSCTSWHAVSKLPADQGNPWTDGKTIVWTNDRHDKGDIYGCSVADDRAFPICSASGEQTLPVVSGDLVVWQDKRNGNWDIYGYSLSRRTEFPICVAPGDQMLPRVSGDTVVWADSRDGGTISAAMVTWPSNGGPTTTPSSVPASPTSSAGDLIGEATSYFSKALVHENSAWAAKSGASFVKQIDEGVQEYNKAVKLMPGDDGSKQYRLALAFESCVRNTITNTRAFAKAAVNHDATSAAASTRDAANSAVKAALALVAYDAYMKASTPSATPTTAPALNHSISEAMSYFVKACVHGENVLKSSDNMTYGIGQINEGLHDYNTAVDLMPHNDGSRQYELAAAFGLCVRNMFTSEKALAKAVLSLNSGALPLVKQVAVWSVKADVALKAYNEYVNSIKG